MTHNGGIAKWSTRVKYRIYSKYSAENSLRKDDMVVYYTSHYISNKNGNDGFVRP